MRKQAKSLQKAADKAYSPTRKHLKKTYRNYVKRFKEKVRSMDKRNIAISDPYLMNFEEYVVARKNLIVTYGKKENINQTLVSRQVYKYDREIAQRLKKAAEEYDLSWKGAKIRELREGQGVDLSEFNEKLKLTIGDKGFGAQRAKEIKNYAFGDSP